MEKLRDILDKYNLRADKRFGQNFLSDINLLDAIAKDSGIDNNSSVLEIGAGTGALTQALAKVAKRVVSIEIDTRLEPALLQTIKPYQNVNVVFGDVLKMQPEKIKSLMGERFSIVANLPYYITTPLIFYFLENDFDIDCITIMVQKEVADRITAQSNTQDYGALTASVWLYAEAKVMRSVPRQMFYPIPDVDSAIVRLKMKQDVPFDKKKALRLIKCAFSMRRKTLINNIMKDYGKSRIECEQILTKLSIDPKVRGESLSPNDLCKISELL